MVAKHACKHSFMMSIIEKKELVGYAELKTEGCKNLNSGNFVEGIGNVTLAFKALHNSNYENS